MILAVQLYLSTNEPWVALRGVVARLEYLHVETRWISTHFEGRILSCPSMSRRVAGQGGLQVPHAAPEEVLHGLREDALE